MKIYLILWLSALLLIIPTVEADDTNKRNAVQVTGNILKKANSLTNREIWKNQRYKVQMTKEGRVGYFRHISITDGRILHEAHPFGYKDKNTLGRVRTYSVPAFNAFINAQANKERRRIKKSKRAVGPVAEKSLSAIPTTSASSQSSSKPVYTTGLGLGYNQSTGYIGAGSTCFNEVTTLNAPNESSQFAVASGATSYGSLIQASASISGSYGLFSASANGTYSNQYAASSNSGSVFFSAAGLYTASNLFYALNDIGTQSESAGTFGQYCGSDFISSGQVGGYTSVQFSWSSTSSTASQAVSTSVSASASSGLGSISGAVTAGQNSSTSADSNTFSLSVTTIGGGTILASAVANATSNNASTQASCEAGSSADCATWAINYNANISSGISGANGFMAAYSNSPSDLSGLVLFPNPLLGIAGQSATETQSIQSLMQSQTSYPDVFKSYAAALSNYVTVYNQIATLSQRANTLYNRVNTYDVSNTLNPIPYIQPLINEYGADASSMLNNLAACLISSNSKNIENKCEPVTSLYNNGILNAYQWYGSSSTNPNDYTVSTLANLQNNSIALQYTGLYSDTTGTILPMDYVWTSQLPGASGGYNTPPSGVDQIYNLPSLIGFADAPWVIAGGSTGIAALELIPINSGYNITNDLSNWQSLEWASISGSNWTYNGLPVSLSFYNGCANTSFVTPCTLMESYNNSSSTNVLTPINEFFGP